MVPMGVNDMQDVYVVLKIGRAELHIDTKKKPIGAEIADKEVIQI